MFLKYEVPPRNKISLLNGNAGMCKMVMRGIIRSSPATKWHRNQRDGASNIKYER